MLAPHQALPVTQLFKKLKSIHFLGVEKVGRSSETCHLQPKTFFSLATPTHGAPTFCQLVPMSYGKYPKGMNTKC